MLTPRFKLSQNDHSVIFWIRAPYCSLKDLEVSVEDEVFIFTCRPYHLRLHLPGKLSDEFSNSSFDTDKGEFEISLKKATPGEFFEDLEFITKLLCPKVEVIESERKITVLTNADPISSDLNDDNCEYGFAMLGNYCFRGVSAEFSDVLEVDPLEVSLPDRRKMRLQLEQGKFDDDHYLADLLDSEVITDHIICSPAQYSEETFDTFTDEELDFLKDLTNVEYSLNKEQVNYCFNSLIDIFYAYCYDRRTTDFEGTIESGWTIVKIAASLSWLDGFKNPKEALISAYRRSLIYPLYRNFSLCEKVFSDLKQILNLGEKCLIKCLITIHKIFLCGDSCHFIFNNLFIKDYIRYIMKWDKETWKQFVEDINQIIIKKEDLGLNLREIEDAAELRVMMSSLQVVEDDSDDSSSDSDSCSESDTSVSNSSESEESDSSD